MNKLNVEDMRFRKERGEYIVWGHGCGILFGVGKTYQKAVEDYIDTLMQLCKRQNEELVKLVSFLGDSNQYDLYDILEPPPSDDEELLEMDE